MTVNKSTFPLLLLAVPLVLTDISHSVLSPLCSQTEDTEPMIFWPKREQPISCMMFTVSFSGEEHVCLSNEEMLIVQNYILEATQVRTYIMNH